MIEIKLDDVHEVSMRRWYGRNECTLEITRGDAEEVLCVLLRMLLKGELRLDLENEDVKALHEYTGVVIAEYEELEAA